MTAKKKTFRAKTLNYIILLGVLLLVNILAQYYHGRLDLTEEKRFTLTKPTKSFLQKLDNDVTVEILLDGDLPAGFKRLQKSTVELLQDFRAQSSYIHYYFNDPNVGTIKERNSRRKEMADRGISPIRLTVKEKNGTTEKFIYPIAVVHYGTRATIVSLLENSNPTLNPELALNKSISLLEYKLANAIQKLYLKTKTNISFVQGHGELPPLAFQDLKKSLSVNSNVTLLDLDTIIRVHPSIDILMIARPQGAYSEKEKFVLDQYIMNGGKVIWMLDKLVVSLDSLSRQPTYVPYDYPLNLDDQLFKYGTRIQPNMVVSIDCAKIPLKVSGNQMDLFPWYYWPIATPSSNHPIVKSLDRVWVRFGSTIDTIKTQVPIKKTILLSTSRYSRTRYIPTQIGFEILREDPRPDKFNKGRQPIAVLLEGSFPSLYKGRVSQVMQQTLDSLNYTIKSSSEKTQMIVISDGDILRNDVDYQNQQYNALGVNRYEKANGYYANKEFLINAVEYLLDDDGIIAARTKEVKLRLLDTVKAEKEKTKWQLVNILLPLLLLLIGGLLYSWIRKRRFAR